MKKKIICYRKIDSTNTECRRLLEKNYSCALSGTVVAASLQTAGRGRLGRAFFSPEGNGVYFSLIYFPRTTVTDAALFTVSAAVAVRRAICGLSGKDALIKWVNDIYIGGKKVCGILTEGVMSPSGSVDAVIIGVGINLFADRGLPEELKDKAGTVFSSVEEAGCLMPEVSCFKKGVFLPAHSGLQTEHLSPEDIFSPFQAAFVDQISENILSILDSEENIIDEYRKYSMLTGKKVSVSPVIGQNGADFDAEVIDITKNGGLLVKLSDGSTKELSSGEVTLHQ